MELYEQLVVLLAAAVLAAGCSGMVGWKKKVSTNEQKQGDRLSGSGRLARSVLVPHYLKVESPYLLADRGEAASFEIGPTGRHAFR